MKILLFGGAGQLGFELQKRAHDLNFEVVSPVVSEVDICDRQQLFFLAKELKPDLIINAAAYTAVDKAETEAQQCFAINQDGAGFVAEAASAAHCRLIHISTDYVFGEGYSAPIPENAATDPLNVYGKSKLGGERQVQEIMADDALIIRTSSLHGKKGDNIVHTFIKLFSERDEISVVRDQVMSPTWAGWLAEVILDLSRIKCHGIVHASSDSGNGISWYDFACGIYDLVRPALEAGRTVKIVPVSSAEYKRPARRSSYLTLSTDKLAGLLGRKPISWEEGLRAHLRELGYAC